MLYHSRYLSLGYTWSRDGLWQGVPQVRRPPDWDTDGDGMPNTWEASKGLDPNDPSDGPRDSDGDGYTNLEDYLNWLAAGGQTPKT
ncbi:MAG: thrombospondin type 3 repeat-containing protein [Sedimentisphaerales bacterium]|nr:thrombospondin type 3 repeat-containing protein [Sedimentisphaerales bacterium]